MPYIESEGYLDFFKNDTFMNIRLVLLGDDNVSHMEWPKTCVQIGVSPDNEDALLRSLVTVMRIEPDIIRLTGSFAEIDAQNNNEEENHDLDQICGRRNIYARKGSTGVTRSTRG